VTPDWILLPLTPALHCIFVIITFTGTWHDYYIITRLLVLLNSCAPKLLYSWTLVTGRLLTLRSWYYTPVDHCYWIIMDIGLLWIPCGHYHLTICNNWITYTGMGQTDEYWYSLHVYDGLILSCDHILGFDLEAIRFFVDVLAPLLSCRLLCVP